MARRKTTDLHADRERGSEPQRIARRSRSFKHSAVQEPKKPLPPPNYMKSTSSFDARSAAKPAKLLRRSSSLKLKRTVRVTSKTITRAVVREGEKVERPTCNSTLKELTFPRYLPLTPGATEAEGPSLIEVCHYKYCSLNGHRHKPAPPLKYFIRERRLSMRVEMSKELGISCSSRGKHPGKGEEEVALRCEDRHAVDIADFSAQSVDTTEDGKDGGMEIRILEASGKFDDTKGSRVERDDENLGDNESGEEGRFYIFEWEDATPTEDVDSVEVVDFRDRLLVDVRAAADEVLGSGGFEEDEEQYGRSMAAANDIAYADKDENETVKDIDEFHQCEAVKMYAIEGIGFLNEDHEIDESEIERKGVKGKTSPIATGHEMNDLDGCEAVNIGSLFDDLDFDESDEGDDRVRETNESYECDDGESTYADICLEETAFPNGCREFDERDEAKGKSSQEKEWQEWEGGSHDVEDILASIDLRSDGDSGSEKGDVKVANKSSQIETIYTFNELPIEDNDFNGSEQRDGNEIEACHGMNGSEDSFLHGDHDFDEIDKEDVEGGKSYDAETIMANVNLLNDGKHASDKGDGKENYCNQIETSNQMNELSERSDEADKILAYNYLPNAGHVSYESDKEGEQESERNSKIETSNDMNEVPECDSGNSNDSETSETLAEYDQFFTGDQCADKLNSTDFAEGQLRIKKGDRPDNDLEINGEMILSKNIAKDDQKPGEILYIISVPIESEIEGKKNSAEIPYSSRGEGTGNINNETQRKEKIKNQYKRRGSDLVSAENCNYMWTIGRGKPQHDSDEDADYSQREPNFLPPVPDIEAEKVDLRHQEMDDRRNADDWMIDHALQHTVLKLASARKKKVELMVEAFESVLPPGSHSSEAFPRHVQACN